MSRTTKIKNNEKHPFSSQRAPEPLDVERKFAHSFLLCMPVFCNEIPYSVFQWGIIWGKGMLQRANDTSHAYSWAILKEVKHTGKCWMDFIAKHHGAVISLLAGNGNVYSYKHNGVEHHFPSIQMPPSTQQLTQMCIQSSHSFQQLRLPKPCRPCWCPAAQWAIESVVSLSAFLPSAIRTRDLLSFIFT